MKMSGEEYRKKTELYIRRDGIREEANITLARFLSGLSLEIKDKVELLLYVDLNDFVQLCTKIEEQNLRKGRSRRDNSYLNSYGKKDSKREVVSK